MSIKRPSLKNVYNFLLLFTCVSMITIWLPLLRCIFDGSSYQWGARVFGVFFKSQGVQIDILYLIINALLGITLLLAFYWIRKTLVFKVLLIYWYGTMAGNIFYDVLVGDRFIFRGDTLGIKIDLTYVLIPLMIILLIIVIYVLRHRSLMVFESKWANNNQRWMVILLSLLPVQAFLFYYGEPHDITDQIGVIITISQVLLSFFLFRRYDHTHL